MKNFIKYCNKIIILLQVLIILLLIAPTSFAQWIQTNGPEGGYFKQILLNSGDLFAFSSSDLFVSTDDGVSWNWRSTFPIEFNKAFLDGFNLFLLGRPGVCFSSDNGMTWTNKNNGLDSIITTFAMERLGNNLFLGGQVQPVPDYPNWTDPYGALYKSSDDGESWQRCNVPFAEYDISINSFLSIDTILLALGQKAVYRSIDIGVSWQMVLNSASFYSPVLSIDSLLIFGGDNSIYRSSDYGASWQVVDDTTGASSFILYNGAILASSGILNQGILRSSDLGKSWYSLPFYFDTDISIDKLYKSNTYLFGINRYYGLFRSSDEGITWENISKDFPTPYNLIPGIIINDSLMLLINFNSGIFRSTDYGTTWKDANSGLTSMPIYSLYAEDNLLLASTAYPSSSRGMLFRTTDNGNNWNITSSDNSNYRECFLRYKDKLYAGTLSGGVVVSTDDGASWMKNGIPGGLINSLAEINDRIYAGIDGINWSQDNGVYITADQGQTWNVTNNGLPYPLSVAKIIVVSESIENVKIIFLATDKGVYHSSDNGNNWLPCNNGIENKNIWTIAVTFTTTKSGLNLFAASHDHFFISNDLGESWTELENSINYQSSIRLYSYPENPGLYSILFAIADSKIFMTSDQGQNWESFGDGIEETHFYDMDINSKYLYAGTSRGVWKRPLSQIIENPFDGKSLQLQYTVEQNYPNPFNPTTTIRYSIPYQSFVTIRIFDILGREIESLIQEDKQVGTYEITWDAANRPSGIYFYKIKAGNYTGIKKMVLIK